LIKRKRYQMRKTVLVLGFLLAAPLATHADPYKWCAVYGGYGGTRESCYYMTVAQCQASVSGVGGFCKPSPWYDGRPVVTPEDRAAMPHRARHRAKRQTSY
jgi:hypothetical protein